MQKKSLGTVVYNRIKTLIMSGALPMGSKISEMMLTRKLESTKAPVRDAIKRLASEGLVEVKPKSGTFVFNFTKDDFYEFLYFRFILEVNALKIVVNIDTDSLIGELSTLYDQMVFSLEKDRVYDYVRLDNNFHETFILASGNRYIIDTYATISPRMSAVSNHLTASSEHLHRGLEHHKKIIKYLALKDYVQLENIINQHILPEQGSYWKLENIKQ